MIIMLGQAVIAYEIFTGKVLLDAVFNAIGAMLLSHQWDSRLYQFQYPIRVPPIYSLLIVGGVLVCFLPC